MFLSASTFPVADHGEIDQSQHDAVRDVFGVSDACMLVRADLLGDAKWPDYLDYCDRFFWGLPPALDRGCLETEAFLPEKCGVILADGYDAEIVRPAPLLQLAAARRKTETERLARTSLRRLVTGGDPKTLPWGTQG